MSYRHIAQRSIFGVGIAKAVRARDNKVFAVVRHREAFTHLHFRTNHEVNREILRELELVGSIGANRKELAAAGRSRIAAQVALIHILDIVFRKIHIIELEILVSEVVLIVLIGGYLRIRSVFARIFERRNHIRIVPTRNGIGIRRGSLGIIADAPHNRKTFYGLKRNATVNHITECLVLTIIVVNAIERAARRTVFMHV